MVSLHNSKASPDNTTNPHAIIFSTAIFVGAVMQVVERMYEASRARREQADQMDHTMTQHHSPQGLRKAIRDCEFAIREPSCQRRRHP